MPTVFLVPAGTDSADGATPGDYLVRRRGDDQLEFGRVSSPCTWIGTIAASLLPDLPDVDAPQVAPEQGAVLAAAQGLESAQDHRGG
jgi:hypothetical protein